MADRNNDRANHNGDQYPTRDQEPILSLELGENVNYGIEETSRRLNAQVYPFLSDGVVDGL